MVDVDMPGTACHKDLFHHGRVGVAPVSGSMGNCSATYWPAQSVNGYNQSGRAGWRLRLASGYSGKE